MKQNPHNLLELKCSHRLQVSNNFGQFPWLISKVIPCFFSNFSYQHYPISPRDGSPEQFLACFPERVLPGFLLVTTLSQRQMRMSWLPGNRRWEGSWHSLSPEVSASPSYKPCSSQWKSSLFTPGTRRFHKSCSNTSHSCRFQLRR